MATTTPLTTGSDTVLPSDEDQIVTATWPTLNIGDRLDAGNGYDVLSLSGDGTFEVNQLASYTGFEEIRLTNTTGAAATLKLRDGVNQKVVLSDGQAPTNSSASSTSGAITVQLSNGSNQVYGGNENDSFKVDFPSGGTMAGGTVLDGGAGLDEFAIGSSGGVYSRVTVDVRGVTLQHVESLTITANYRGSTSVTATASFLADVTTVTAVLPTGPIGGTGTSSASLSISEAAVDLRGKTISVRDGGSMNNRGYFSLAGTNESGTTFYVDGYDTARFLSGSLGGSSTVISSTVLTFAQRQAVLSRDGYENGIRHVIDPNGAYTTLIDVTTENVLTNRSVVTVAGVVDSQSNGTVKIFEGNVQVGTATVGSGGNWSTNVTLSGDGAHELRAEAQTNAGDKASDYFIYTLDTSAPVVTITSSGGTTSSSTVVVSGKAVQATQTSSGTTTTPDVGATVRVMEGSTLVGTAITDGNGVWAVSATLSGSGQHTLTAFATDKAGNTGQSGPITFNYQGPGGLTVTGTEGDDDGLPGHAAILSGTAQNDTLYGLGGNDVLDGGTGADTMVGGTGNDIYVVENTGDIVVEKPGEGIDTVNSYLSMTLGADLENLNLFGSGNLVAGGNAFANALTGNMGNNILDGGGGADTMRGGHGADVYVVENAGDVVIEEAGAGLDTVNSYINYTLTANVENLSLIGSGDLVGGGNALGNKMYGNAGNDVLDGGAGTDTMIGGAGNDTYVVDSSADVVTELAGEGTDTVNAYASYTLSANVENLTLIGTTAMVGIGNELGNVMYGSAFAGDVLDGRGGVDTMIGGLGDDRYVVDVSDDRVVELAGEGFDTVSAATSYSLGANLEVLVLLNPGAGVASDWFAGGNEFANYLYGNLGNNLLDGRAGADTMYGGDGSDTYVVDDAGDLVGELDRPGIDTVNSFISYSLGSSVENLTLFGTANLVAGGNGLGNVLIGNAGNNILDGSTGADTMFGGGGDDTYVVDDAGDQAAEGVGAGLDTVNSYVSLSLGGNIENLTLLGTGNLVGGGNGLGNVLIGNSGSNTIDGSTGADTMIGGGGDDTFVVDDLGDIVAEGAGGGTDTVNSYVGFSLGTNIENLSLLGSAAIDGSGNESGNRIIGNGANNVLDGLGGIDALFGGGGDDTFVFRRGQSAGDTIGDFAGTGPLAGDALQFVGYGTAAQGATLTQLDGTRWSINSADGLVQEVITLANGAAIHPSDYVFV